MCGIAGLINFYGRPVLSQDLKAMTDVIEHRGPDGEGHWISKNGSVGFGHRRLSIIDISEHGSQPMHYLGRYTVTFNGEIYNYVELRDELKASGAYSFESTSDTEVLLAAYDYYGKDCVKHFDGMFAFAIYDQVSQTVFCARDRFGEKPFFYWYDKEQFVFASEMKSMWRYGIPKQLEDESVYTFLVSGREQISQTSTFFKGISRLQQSHTLTIDVRKNELEYEKYWDVSTRQEPIGTNDAIEKFRFLFDSSVSRRLRSDVPVGSSLSGGLDSSLVVGTMANMLSGNSLHTFSASFPGFEKDETKYQKMVVNRVGSNHHSITPNFEENLSLFDKVLYHQEEPFGSTSINTQYKVFESARAQNISVLLDGQGADELLSGYSYYTLGYIYELSRKLKFLNIVKTVISANKNQSIPVGYSLMGGLSGHFPESIVRRVRKDGDINARAILNPDFVSKWKDTYTFSSVARRTLNENLYHSILVDGLSRLLQYCDRNAMAHSVEVRLPFLSHTLVEFAFSLPSELKIHNGWSKWIARKAAQGTVPEEIIWRREKVGYENPDIYLQKNANHPMIQELLEMKELDKYYVDTSTVPKLFYRKLMLAKLLKSIG